MGVLGKPKFKRGDSVEFVWRNRVLQGVVKVVDAYGTLEQSVEPSYDISVSTPGSCGVYKHIRESEIILI